MAFKTVKEALTSKSFRGQLFMTILINFAINFGFGWGSYNGWGKRTDTSTWAQSAVWAWNYELNSNLAMDLSLTSFFIGCFCMLLGTNGALKEVHEKKCDYLAVNAIPKTHPLARFTPLKIQNLCLRSLAVGFYFWILTGVPTILVLWMAIGSGTMPGLSYVILKGIFAAIVCQPVFVLVFLSAIDARNFPELEFDALMKMAGGSAGKDAADGETPPLVGNVGLI